MDVAQTSDVLLVLEVADTTIDYDLGTKVPLYESVGVPEVWVVDREARQVHVFRQSATSIIRAFRAASASSMY